MLLEFAILIIITSIILFTYWKKYYPQLVFFSLGTIVLVWAYIKDPSNAGGWSGMFFILILITVIIPIYIVGFISWLVEWIKKRQS